MIWHTFGTQRPEWYRRIAGPTSLSRPVRTCPSTTPCEPFRLPCKQLIIRESHYRYTQYSMQIITYLCACAGNTVDKWSTEASNARSSNPTFLTRSRYSAAMARSTPWLSVIIALTTLVVAKYTESLLRSSDTETSGFGMFVGLLLWWSFWFFWLVWLAGNGLVGRDEQPALGVCGREDDDDMDGEVCGSPDVDCPWVSGNCAWKLSDKPVGPFVLLDASPKLLPVVIKLRRFFCVCVCEE